MATTLGTKLGTMLGTELVDMVAPAPAPTTIAGLLPQHRHRASQAATSGGNLVSIPNEGSGGGQLNVIAGTLAAPTADAALNNAQSLVFTGSQELASSLPPAAYKLLHDGSAFTAYLVGVPTANAMQVTTRGLTFAGSTGIALATAPTQSSMTVLNSGTPTPVNIVISGAAGTGVGQILRASFSAGTASAARDGGTPTSAAPAAALSSSDPFATLTLGRIPTGAFLTARWAEVVIFDRLLTAPELAVVDAELFATYGKHA